MKRNLLWIKHNPSYYKYGLKIVLGLIIDSQTTDLHDSTLDCSHTTTK